MASPAFDAQVRIALGLGLVVVGLLVARYARFIADLGELLDAIGSTTRASEARAADWNVRLTRYGGLLAALFGAVLALFGVLYFV